MIAKRSPYLVGAFVAMSALSQANAADLGGARGGSIKDDMPVMMQQSAARFYLRADGAYAGYDSPQIDLDGKFDLFDARMSGSWSAGGGIGYYINRNWRADFTLEQRFNTDVSGTYQFDGGTSDGKFGLKSTLGLFNIYYDFDNRTRFTPYLGAGIGWVDHKTSTGSFTDSCGCTSTIESGHHSSVAGALMAGVAINLTGRGPSAGSGEGGGEAARNLYLDLGYRFLYLGEAQTGKVTANYTTPAGPALVADDPTVSEIHAHEFRVGLRYDFR